MVQGVRCGGSKTSPKASFSLHCSKADHSWSQGAADRGAKRGDDEYDGLTHSILTAPLDAVYFCFVGVVQKCARDALWCVVGTASKEERRKRTMMMTLHGFVDSVHTSAAVSAAVPCCATRARKR